MSRSDLDAIKMQKYYIVTQPTPLSQLELEDMDAEPDRRIMKKARNLRARRDARLRNRIDF